jgi:hypothetical protein
MSFKPLSASASLRAQASIVPIFEYKPLSLKQNKGLGNKNQYTGKKW